MGEQVRFELHEAPTLLMKELTSLFPGIDAFRNPNHSVSVITMAHETQSDMSVWSNEMESERELLTEEFVYLAKEVCGRYIHFSYIQLLFTQKNVNTLTSG